MFAEPVILVWPVNLIWRSIEVVITSRTRNAVVRKGTWVRIPPYPPTKPVIAMVTGF